jgi:hypothetical protein
MDNVAEGNEPLIQTKQDHGLRIKSVSAKWKANIGLDVVKPRCYFAVKVLDVVEGRVDAKVEPIVNQDVAAILASIDTKLIG